MHPLVVVASTSVATVDVAWTHRPLPYLAAAGLCLLVALRLLKRTLAPIGTLLQLAAGAVVAAVAVLLALAVLVAAVFATVP